MINRSFTVVDELGIHARPASTLVKNANKFSSIIKIEYKGKQINIKSIIGLMTLGVKYKDKLTISAEGEDETEAIAKLEKVIEAQGIGKMIVS